MKNHQTIGVFFGSRNPEHDVSIITAQLIISELRKIGYSVVPVYVDKQGRWFADQMLGSLKFFTDGDIEEKLKALPQCVIDIDASRGKLVLKAKRVLAKEIVVDLAFPAFHGAHGEDGTVQGVFELAGIPYVGCGVTASAVTLDKVLTKQMYLSAGISTTDFRSFSKFDWHTRKEGVLGDVQQLRWPVFVKPARLGSSIGIAKAHNAEELEQSIEVALHYDEKVIVEESVEDMMDVTCAVLGNHELTTSLVQEAVFSGEHFSYEAKYLEDGGAQLGNAEKNIIIPARLSEERTQEVYDISKRVFKLLDCSGIARVDFLYDRQHDRLYANEVNTLPGTLYHHLWKASGMSIDVLLKKLISLAQERHQEKAAFASTFRSEILKYANSVKLQMGKKE